MKHRRPSPILRPLHLAIAVAATLASLQPATATIFPSPGPYWNAIEIAPANGLSNQLVPHALNDAGWVVGSFNDAGGDRGFIWSGVSGHVPQRLPLSDAWGIRPDGTVLGAALGSSLRREGFTSLTGREYAVQVAPNGAITVLTPTNLTTNNAGQTFGMAFAANAAGTVVGVSTDAAGQYGAALWSGGSGPSFIDISTGSRPGGFLGGRSSLAINDAGTVVGGTHQLQTWSAAQGRTDLGGLTLATSTSGADINNAGLIVGTSSFSDGLSNGFIYRPDTASFTVLSGLGGQGTGSSAAWALNERGDVVGLSGVVGRVESRATWWKPGGEVVDLNSLNFTNLSGVRLQTAIDINNRGQILVSGMRENSLGQITDAGLRHWVLTLCERCGQIAPYPNATGTTLDIGPDWYDAFNDLTFDNQGTLLVGTSMVNKVAGRIENAGQLLIQPVSGHLRNAGVLTTAGDGITTVDGTLTNDSLVQTDGLLRVRSGGRLVNNALVAVRPNGKTWIEGGEVINHSRFAVVDAEFVLSPGANFANGAGSQFFMMGGTAEIRGNLSFDPDSRLTLDALDPLEGTGAQLDVKGTTLTLNGSAIALSDGSKLQILGPGGQLVAIDGGIVAQRGARLVIEGGDTPEERSRLTLTRTNLTIGGANAEGPSELSVLRGVVELGGTTQVATFGDPGRIFAQDSEIDVSGAMRVRPLGRVDLRGESTLLRVSAGGALTVNGEILGIEQAGLSIDAGAMWVTRTGLVSLNGEVLKQHDGQLTIERGGRFQTSHSFTQLSGVSIINGLLQAPRLVFLSGEVRGDGTLRGRVEIYSDNVQLDPRLHIGNSPGTLTIDGDLALDGAVFELELGDGAHDQLVVTGLADLGRMHVVLQPQGGYLPDLDESFSFVRAAGITTLNGDDSQVTLDIAALGSGWVQTFRLGATGLQTTLDRLDTEELADVPAGATTRVDAGTWRYSRRLNVDGLLEVAGQLTHRVAALDLDTGAVLEAGQLVVNGGAALSVLEGGVFSNRSELQSFGQILNTGLLYNRAGGTIDSQFQIRNDGVLRNDGLIRLNAGTAHNTGRWEERGRLEVGTGAVVENTGQVELQGTLVNQGLVINAGQVRVLAGGTLTGAQDASAAPASSGIYQQVGATSALTRVDGVLAQSRIDIIDGTLEGTGRVLGAINLGGATLRPGGMGEVGQLTLEGAVSLSGTVIELTAGPDGASRLNVQGSLDIGLGSQLYLVYQLADLRPAPDTHPDPLAPGTHLDLLSVEGSLSGAHLLSAHVLYVDPQGGRYFWSPPAGQTASFRWQGQHLVFDVTAVPEPGTWALLLGGLALLVARSRWRDAPQAPAV